MAVSPQQRQRKIERQRAKAKTKQRKAARGVSLGMAARLERVAAAPILHCCASRIIWEEGLGNVLVSRQLENGNVAYGSFLLDVYCLGVKDAMGGFEPREVYDDLYEQFCEKCELQDLRPACARKLVEGALAYAADLGFDPHPDYRKFKSIFGAIDPGECTTEFEYGFEGKPYFIAGPYDGRETARILSILENRCGSGGYRCLLPGFSGLLDS